mgnify:CR=1 FL=1
MLHISLLGASVAKERFKHDVLPVMTAMAAAFGVPYLGDVPLDPVLQRACDAGQSLVDDFQHASSFAPFSAVLGALRWNASNGCGSPACLLLQGGMQALGHLQGDMRAGAFCLAHTCNSLRGAQAVMRLRGP